MLLVYLVLNMLKYYLKTFCWLVVKLFYMFSKTFDLFLIYCYKMQSFPYENHCECYKKLTSTQTLAIYFPVFSFTYTLLVCGKIKSCCDHCFPQQIRPQNTSIIYIIGLILLGD